MRFSSVDFLFRVGVTGLLMGVVGCCVALIFPSTLFIHIVSLVSIVGFFLIVISWILVLWIV